MPYSLAKATLGPLLRTLWRMSIEGAEHVPADGPVILASNHVSIMDSTFLPLAVARPVTFVAKAEYFTGTRFVDRATSRFLRGAGQIPVQRDAAGRAALTSLNASLEVLQRGEIFCIYPEGTRSPDGRLYRARTGVGWLALTSGAPVVPVAMIGTAHVLPPGRRVPRLGRVGVRFGPVVDTSTWTGGAGAGSAGGAGSARARRAVADDVVRAIRALSGQEYVPGYAPRRDPAEG